jgi:membrane protease YdiL (CAAX protease family)
LGAPSWRLGVELARAVGWNTGQGVAREIFAGIVGYIAGIPLLVFAMIIFLIISRFDSTYATHPIEFELTKGGWVRILIIVLASIFAPITEELMFRGCFLRYLTGRLPAVCLGRVRERVFRRDSSPGLDGAAHSRHHRVRAGADSHQAQ